MIKLNQAILWKYFNFSVWRNKILSAMFEIDLFWRGKSSFYVHSLWKVYETQFEVLIYVTFASIFGLNYNLSLIYEKGPIYTKLEFQKMSSSYSGCQSIFQIVFTIISHFGSQLPISSNVLKEETSKGTTNYLLELWSSHFSCRISLLSGVTCNSDTQADWSLHIQYQ